MSSTYTQNPAQNSTFEMTLPIQAVSTTPIDGDTVDVRGFEWLTCVIQTGTATGATSVIVVLAHSADGSSWGAFDTITITSAETTAPRLFEDGRFLAQYRLATRRRYVRATVVCIGGTHGLSVGFQLSGAKDSVHASPQLESDLR
jgi:hypothetical protein